MKATRRSDENPHPTWISILLALAVAGCAGTTRLYDGPARPPGEIATLVVDPSISSTLTINQRDVRGFRFEIPPGRTAVDFRIARGSIGSATIVGVVRIGCSVAFVAEAGQHYRVFTKVERGDQGGYIGSEGYEKGHHVSTQQVAFIGEIEHVETGDLLEAECGN